MITKLLQSASSYTVHIITYVLYSQIICHVQV